MGFHAFGRRDERRYALRLLSVILGENMSSRLFQTLRERHGYCYSVQTNIVTLDDTGCIHICAGLDPEKLGKSLQMILRELARICRSKPSASELKKAQDYAVGQTFMGLESTTNQMMWMGESLLSFPKVLDPAAVERKVLAVTAEEVQACGLSLPAPRPAGRGRRRARGRRRSPGMAKRRASRVLDEPGLDILSSGLSARVTCPGPLPGC